MPRYKNSLRLSVSTIALIVGAGVTGTPSYAVTISSDQTGYTATGSITDGLIIASGVTVSPDGVLIDIGGKDQFTGDLVNDGTVQIIVDDDPANTFLFGAIKASGAVTGDLLNKGSIKAQEVAQTSATDTVSAIGDVNLVTPMFAAATTAGIFAGTVGGNVSNMGGVSAESASNNSYSADISATGDVSVEMGSRSFASAWGIDVSSLAGDFLNAQKATISASADAKTEGLIEATGVNVVAGYGELNSSANGVGVQLGSDFSGPIRNFKNDGAISVAVNSAVTAGVSAAATGGTAEAMWGNYDPSSNGAGVFIENNADSFTNTGDITISTLATLSSNAEASGNEALIEQTSLSGNNVTSQNDGVLLATVEGAFVNGGNIKSAAVSNAAMTASATATDGVALVGLEGDDISALATGVSMSGDPVSSVVNNTGDIAASSSASVDQNTQITATDGMASYLNPATLLNAGAQGFSAGSLSSFSNSGKISAQASLDGSFDLAVSGTTAALATTTGSDFETAIGVTIVNTLSGDFTNSGDITASAKAVRSVAISAEATDGMAIITEKYNISSLSAGVAGHEFDGSLTNIKNISADSTVTATIDLAADGADGTSVKLSNTVANSAYGVTFAITPGGVVGDIINSGSIKAVAASDIKISASAIANGDPGTVAMHNEISVIAEGLIEGAATPDNGTPHGLINKGTISADASLKLSVTEGSDQFSFVKVNSVGAFLSGSLDDIANSGTINASGHFDGAKAADLTATGFIVGLWVTTPNAQTTVSNTGTITASLDGTGAANATVAAVDVGFFVNLSSKEPGPDDAVTVTNSGTISASNTFGQSYGIYAGQTPLPVVINQQGGSISASTAIEIVDNKADTVNWTGGEIHGLVHADALDVVNVFTGTGTPASKVITAGADFTLEGAGELNIGNKGAPVTFVMNGLVTNVDETNLNTDGKLVVGPTAKIDTGTFNQNDGSTLVIQFNPTKAGLITTTGDFNADGNLQTQALPGLYGDKGSHIVIDAGGVVAGKFDSVGTIGDTLLIDFTTKVNPSDVTVSWKRNAFNEVEGLSDNSAAVAGALEDGYNPLRAASKNTPELNDQLAGLFTLTDAEKYDRVLNSWSGSEHAQVMQAAANLSEPYLMAIGEHINDNRSTGFREQNVVMLRPKGSSGQIAPATSVGASGSEETGLAFWGRAFGRWASTRGDSNADGFDEDTYGAVLGVDFQLSPTVLLGIAGSYVDDDMNFDDGDAGKIKRWSIGGYASATFDAFYIDGSFTYASDSYRVHRTIITGGAACLSYTCSTGTASRYSGDGLIAHAEAGFNWKLGEGARLQPFAGLNYTSIDTDPFAETGGGDLGLEVLDGTGKSFQSRLGARLSGDWGSGDVKWVPELRAEWRHEFENDPAWIVSNLVGVPNEPFTTVGSHVGRDLAVIGAGVTAQMANGWGLYLDYQGAFASGYHSHVFQGGVRVRF